MAGVKDFKRVYVSPKNHKALEGLGGKGENFNDIIERLIRFYVSNKGGRSGD